MSKPDLPYTVFSPSGEMKEMGKRVAGWHFGDPDKWKTQFAEVPEETLLEIWEAIRPRFERRCVPVYDGKYRNTPRCSLCGELLADGVLKLPRYCGECGARVMGE